MASHVSHIGVHDHGFNNVSTYGNLWRLTREGRIDDRPGRLLRAGAEGQRRGAGRPVARPRRTAPATSTRSTGRSRCSSTRSGRCRALAVAHLLGHVLMGEHDERISLLRPADRARRATPPATTSSTARAATRTTCAAAPRTSRCSTSTTAASAARARSRATRRSAPGRADWPGRCSGSPSSWSSSATLSDEDLEPYGGRDDGDRDDAATPPGPPATSTWSNTPADGVPYWDTGAPGPGRARRLPRPAGRPVQRPRAGRLLGRRDRRAGPAAAGPLPRRRRGDGPALLAGRADRGWTRSSTSRTCRTDPQHQGLILHSVYHRPNGWDHVADRAAGAQRRVEHVGRLPRPRGRALPAAGGPATSRTTPSSAAGRRRGDERGASGSRSSPARSRGIGRGIAAGARPAPATTSWSTTRATPTAADEVVERGRGARACGRVAVQADIVGGRRPAAPGGRDATPQFGRVDLLVNNAGVAPIGAGRHPRGRRGVVRPGASASTSRARTS